jgi:hypothetical protein
LVSVSWNRSYDIRGFEREKNRTWGRPNKIRKAEICTSVRAKVRIYNICVGIQILQKQKWPGIGMEPTRSVLLLRQTRVGY